MAVSSYGSATRDERRRAHREGPRPRPDRPARDHRRGHRRQRAHARSTCASNLEAREPGQPRGVRAARAGRACRSGDLDLRYVGFRIPPEFVIGYGLDVAERYRNLPYVVHRTSGRADGRRPMRRPARPSGIDQARIEKAVREILIAIGEDPDRDGLLDTPARVARMYAEIFAGLHEDPARPPHGHVRGRPRRDGDGPRHPAVLGLRAPPRAVRRARPTSPTSRTTTAGSPACRSSPGWSTASPGGRRSRSGSRPRSPTRSSRPARAEGRAGGDRGRAPLHVDARRRKPGAITVTSAVRGLFRTSAATRAEAMRSSASRQPPLTGRHVRRSQRLACRDPECAGNLPAVFRSADVCGARPVVMGVVNVTPDSFSDGGRYLDSGRRRSRTARARRPTEPTCSTWAASRPGPAPIRSTRPRSCAACCPSCAGLAGEPACRSASTPARPRSPAAALDAGATLVNDVSAGRSTRGRSTWPPTPARARA